MNVTMDRNGTELNVRVEGRLDTLTSPQLEEQLEPALDGVTKLIFDFEALDYISSAGLRILLACLQTMEDRDGMIVRNVSRDVMEIFEVTGFVDVLTVE